MSQNLQTPQTGDLKQYMLPEIFLKAVLQQFSGVLDIENDSISKLIYFKNGNVVFVESNDREETFGHFLMRKKLIDPKSLNEALQDLATQVDMKLGEVLLKKGYMDPNSLMVQLNLHQEEKLFNTFAIKKGKYTFNAEMVWPDYVTVFPFRTLNVFFSAIESHISLDEIESSESLIPSTKIQLNHQPSRDLPLPPFATRLANCLNRNWITINDLAAKLSVPIAKVLTYVYIFKLADWISSEEIRNEEVLGNSNESKRVYSDGLPPADNSDNIIVSKVEDSVVEKKEMNPLLQQRLDIEYRNIGEANFYQMFNVGAKFTGQQIQISFFQIIAEYKKYEDYPKGKEIISWIKIAIDVLKDPKMRMIYDYRFGFRKRTPESEISEKQFFRAIRLIEKKDFETALPILEEINLKCPDSSYRAYLAWVLFQIGGQKNITDVEKYLEEGFKLYPADPFAHYIAGQVAVSNKNPEKAQNHFRSALQVFPTFAEAAQALESVKFEKTKERLVEKNEKSKKEPGFFDLSVGGFSFTKKD